MANEVNLPGLVVDIEARIDKLEKGIAKANALHKRGSTDMENRARQSAKKLEQTYASSAEKIGATFEQMFAGFRHGGAALLAVGGMALAVKEIAGTVAEVEREARKAGVTAKVWQQWTYVAAATGMSIDGVTDALKELNIRGDEFARTGKGSAEEAFKRLGYTATDVAQRLRDPSAFLDEIIGKLRTMDSAAQTRILDEVLGGTGAEEMAKLLGLSVEQIQKLRSEAATFTDEQIEAAKRIDAAWDTMWRNFMVRAKGMAIEGVEIAKKIVDTINAPYNESQRLSDQYYSPAEQLKRLQAQRADILAAIERERAGDSAIKDAEIRNLETSLKAIEEQILALGGGSKAFNDALREMSAMSNKLTPALSSNTTAATNFKNALAELKAMVPGLKAELDALAQSDNLNTAYQNAVRNARSMGQVWQATDIANRAKTVASVDAAKAEPTGTLEANLALGKNRSHIDGMASEFAEKLATMLASMPDDLKGKITINSGYRSVERQQQLWLDALKKYGSVEEARKWVAPPGNSQHNKGNAADLGYGSDAARQWAHENASRFGLSFPLGNENWHIEDADARRSDNAAALQRQTDLVQRQADARRDLNQAVQEGLSRAQFEQSIAGMSESQKRVELELYDRLAQAKRAGVMLSSEEVQKLREKIAMTEQLNQKNQQVTTTTQGLQNAQRFFAEGFTQSLSGLLTGTTTLQQAVQNLLNSLIDATLQAALLGKGPLSGLFGGGTGLFGMLFGFAEGGYTGSGGKYQPAGVVHRGEYVFSKSAVDRIGVDRLDAAHRSLKGYAAGGLVGAPPRLDAPRIKREDGNRKPAPVVINSPITVNGSAGTPEQNADLAKRMRRESEQMMRALVRSEIFSQMKPGNLLNR